MRVVLISAVAALGGFLFGFDTAVINGAVTALRDTFQLGSGLTGFAVSIALIGAAMGAFAAGPIADKLGRVPAMRIAAILFAVSALGSGLPVTIWDFMFWRWIGGVAVGAASVIAPAYIAEVSPAHLRGRLGSLQQLAIVTGIAVALFGNQFIAMATETKSATGDLLGFKAWQWMFWAELIPAAGYLVGTFFIPESPRYLVKKGKEEEARGILAGILKTDAQTKVDEIKASLHNQPKSSIKDLFGGKFGLLPIVWVGMLLSVFQQFVGINVVFYYSSLLWQSVGVTEDKALLNTTIGGITNLLTTFVAIALVDKIGRKPLLLAGSLGMMLTLGVLAYIFQTAPLVEGKPVLSKEAGVTALIAFNLYIVSFGSAWGPIVWVLLGEMFSNRIRALALALAASVQWIANFAISTTFPAMAEISLGFAYGFYAVCALLSFVFVLKCVRETKGVELEAMPES